MGRPSLYTDALAEEICDRLATGESMRAICSAESMPDRSTILRWLSKDAAFAAKCARAWTLQADVMDDRIMEVVDGTLDGKIDPQVAKVAISAFQWQAAKRRPDKYGDRVQLGGPAGADGSSRPIEVHFVGGAKSDDEARKP